MKAIIFSDLHGNSYAFDSFLRQMKHEKYDAIIFCGDVFGYYYNQKEILQKLQTLEGLIWLKGNHDEYFCQLYSERTNTSALEDEFIRKYGHSYEGVGKRFSAEEYLLISGKPTSLKFTMNGMRIGIFHGTPEDELEGRLYPKDCPNVNSFCAFDIVILGHTHFRMVRQVGNTLVINPGSLGQPRDGQGYSYCVLDLQAKKVEFRNVLIDTTELYRQIELFDPDLEKLKKVLERKKEDIV